MTTYWIINYIFDLALFIVVSGVFVICELFFRVRFFTQTSPLLTFLLFILWGNCMIAMAFFFTTIFNKSRTATVFGYLFVIASVIAAEVLNAQIYQFSDPPLWYWVFPPFTFYRGVFLMFMRCMTFDCYATSELLAHNSQILKCFLFMLGEVVALMVAASYLNLVLPSQYGIRKNPLFFIIDPILFVRSKIAKKKPGAFIVDQNVSARASNSKKQSKNSRGNIYIYFIHSFIHFYLFICI